MLMIQTAQARTVSLEEVPQSFSGISSISITNPGTGYTTAPTVTITGDGVGATAEAIIVNGALQTINITSRGIDYTRAVVTIYLVVQVMVRQPQLLLMQELVLLRTVYYDTNAERQIVILQCWNN
jgi:hypothetical protein